ncbi:MAG: hypothetical protein ACI9VR_000892 [Cognaticolwellia sp.]|jgi:hypothetical protein
MPQQQRRRVNATDVQQNSSIDAHAGHEHADGEHMHEAPSADFLGQLFGGGEVDHTTGEEVDAYVQADDFFNYYIQSSFDASGNGADGKILILDDAAFQAEWIPYAMARRNPATGEVFTQAEAIAFGVNAFEDNGRIVLHKNRGTPGTAVHESMHLFTHSSYARTMGFHINEGTTELFTRLLCSRVGIEREHNYQAEYTAVYAVATGLDGGHNLLASAYFDGSYQALRDAMNTVPGRYEQWQTLMQAENFTAAAALF